MSAPTLGPEWRRLPEGEQIPDGSQVVTWANPWPEPILVWVAPMDAA